MRSYVVSLDIRREIQISSTLERRVYAGSYVKQIAVRRVVSLKSTELCSCKTGSRDLACIYTYV